MSTVGADNSRKKRLSQIPVVFAHGDYFTVGLIMGRQMRSLIEDHLEGSDYLQKTLLPAYETPEGKALYDRSLQLCRSRFPNYVVELEGMASGSRVPFHKLFLMSLDVFTTSFTEMMLKKKLEDDKKSDTGCTCILSHGKELLLGHTEDTGMELLNNVFILSAEIVDERGTLVEKFSTFTYAGCLPGYTMGFNEAFVHSVNTLVPGGTSNQKSPRSYVARALLAAKSLEQVIEILKDSGTGISDGFSLNAIFPRGDNGEAKAVNIEIIPNPDGDESRVNVLEVAKGDTFIHCNKILRIQNSGEPVRLTVGSTRRHAAASLHPKPERMEVLKGILGDGRDSEYPIFRTGEGPKDFGVTAVVGIFDLGNSKWQIYTGPPNECEPIAELPLPY